MMIPQVPPTTYQIPPTAHQVAAPFVQSMPPSTYADLAAPAPAPGSFVAIPGQTSYPQNPSQAGSFVVTNMHQNLGPMQTPQPETSGSASGGELESAPAPRHSDKLKDGSKKGKGS